MNATTSIRLTEEDRKKAQAIADAYGLPSIAAAIRFAIRKVKSAKA